MCPKGRPTQDKRDKRFEMRLSAETYKTLEECAKSLSITKSDVVHKGIALVKAELDKRNRVLPTDQSLQHSKSDRLPYLKFIISFRATSVKLQLIGVFLWLV